MADAEYSDIYFSETSYVMIKLLHVARCQLPMSFRYTEKKVSADNYSRLVFFFSIIICERRMSWKSDVLLCCYSLLEWTTFFNNSRQLFTWKVWHVAYITGLYAAKYSSPNNLLTVSLVELSYIVLTIIYHIYI